MERWSKIAEWFDLNREKITLVAGGIGVVFSLLGVRLGLPFDWAWFTIVLCGLPIVWGAAVAMYEEFDIKADLTDFEDPMKYSVRQNPDGSIDIVIKNVRFYEEK